MIIRKFVDWFFSPSVKEEFFEDFDLYDRLVELEEKYNALILDVKRLEEENVELTNELYRMENSLDARIDILAEHCRINYDV
jgi:predicted nuclease with TOPRIM domain